MFGVRVSELSLYARAWYHAKSVYRTIRPVDKCHPFITSLGQYQRIALDIVNEHLNEMRRKENLTRPVLPPNMNCYQTRNIVEALEDGVSHVYIQGTPGIGKTEIIDWYLRGRRYWKAGEPSNFLFGTLVEKIDFIWFEDFDMFKYGAHLNTLLALMDHKETTISRKGVDDRTIICPARHIYISNYNIPNDYPMFQRRLKVFNLDHKLYECQCAQHLQYPLAPPRSGGVGGVADLDTMDQEIIEELLNSF